MSEKADETVTVRLPKGTAAKLRAATGVPFSTMVRMMVMALLNKYAAEGQQPAFDKLRQDIADAAEGAE